MRSGFDQRDGKLVETTQEGSMYVALRIALLRGDECGHELHRGSAGALQPLSTRSAIRSGYPSVAVKYSNKNSNKYNMGCWVRRARDECRQR